MGIGPKNATDFWETSRNDLIPGAENQNKHYDGTREQTAHASKNAYHYSG